MGWSWADFEDCPADVITRLLKQVEDDAEKRAADEQARELKRRHGR